MVEPPPPPHAPKAGPARMFSFLARLHPLGREITLLLVLKVAALTVIANMFFSADDRPAMNGDALDRHLLSLDSLPAADANQENGSVK